MTGALRWNVKEGLKWEVMESDMEMNKCEEEHTGGVMESTEIGKCGGTVMGSEGGMENMEDRDRRW